MLRPRSITAVLAAAAALIGMTTLPATASAAGNANGIFHYTDLLGGTQQIHNPQIGPCHLPSTLATSASNQTDATVLLYTDTSCALLANPLPPGSTITFIYKSFRFVKP